MSHETNALAQTGRDTATGEVAIHDRANLTPLTVIPGAAIVTEDETSTLFGPGWTTVINSPGHVEMTRG